jgi:hypothetical protein
MDVRGSRNILQVGTDIHIYKRTCITASNLVYMNDDDDDNSGELWDAAFRGDFDYCLHLLTTQEVNPAHINSRHGTNGTTPLFCAIRRCWHGTQHLAIVELLLQYGADTSVINDDESTAIHAAVMFGTSLEFLSLLLETNPININAKYIGETALFMAISNSFTHDRIFKQQVDALLLHGADVEDVDRHGNSVLHQVGIDQWLLPKFLALGVDIDIRGENGRTPLHQIVFRCRRYGQTIDEGRDMFFVRQIQLFLDAGASIDIKDGAGRTAEELALFYLPFNSPVCKVLRDWRELREARLAFASGTHHTSVTPYVSEFTPELVRMILDPGWNG